MLRSVIGCRNHKPVSAQAVCELCDSYLIERIFSTYLFSCISRWRKRLDLLQSTPLCAEEAMKHVLNVVDMALVNVLANLEVIAEHRRACAAHHAQLLG
jgi:hypothetical protein